MGLIRYGLDEEIERDVKCQNCGKIYSQIEKEQVPGFRDLEYDTCPYCNTVNGRSMTYEYLNSKKEEN